MFHSLKEQDAALKLREHEVYHKSKMEEWAMLGMQSSSSSRSEPIHTTAPCVTQEKIEQPLSTLNLASGLAFCRRWLLLMRSVGLVI